MTRPSLSKLHPHLARSGIHRSLNSMTINFQKTMQDVVTFWCYCEMKCCLFLWFILAGIRILWSLLPQNGYIHPDEFFQSSEVVAGDMLNVTVNRPWEFESEKPVRSIVFPFFMAGIPFRTLKFVARILSDNAGFSKAVSTYTVLAAPRLFMAALSFIGDYTVATICNRFKLGTNIALLMYASSYVTMVYQTRTFSNTLEALIFNILLLFTIWPIAASKRSDLQKARFPFQSSGLLACIIVCGVFNRPTFILFAIIPLLHWLYLNCTGIFTLLSRVVAFGIGAVFTFFVLGLVDSAYFSSEFVDYAMSVEKCIEDAREFTACFNNWWSHFIITPWNFVLYNTNFTNLSLHGVHRKFLHVLVNVPMLFGPATIVLLAVVVHIIFRLIGRKLPSRNITLFVLSIFVPIACLSVFPHQEPRYLTPLLAPIIILVSMIMKTSALKGKFLTVWILFNIIFSLLYGIIHQGGIVPSIKTIKDFSDENCNYPEQVHAVYYHTYMPPEHLFLNQQKVKDKNSPDLKYLNQWYSKCTVQVHDLMGASFTELEHLLQTLANENNKEKIILVTPATVARRHSMISTKFKELERIFPHLSMEDPPNFTTYWNLFYNKPLSNWGRLADKTFDELSLRVLQAQFL